jgi:hypothetical protein
VTMLPLSKNARRVRRKASGDGSLLVFMAVSITIREDRIRGSRRKLLGLGLSQGEQLMHQATLLVGHLAFTHHQNVLMGDLASVIDLTHDADASWCASVDLQDLLDRTRPCAPVPVAELLLERSHRGVQQVLDLPIEDLEMFREQLLGQGFEFWCRDGIPDALLLDVEMAGNRSRCPAHQQEPSDQLVLGGHP